MNRESFIVGVLLIFLLLSSCASQPKSPLKNLNNCSNEFSVKKYSIVGGVKFEQCRKNIPLKYEMSQYCEIDSDCVLQQISCETISVNKYNPVEDYLKKVWGTGTTNSDSPHCGYSRHYPSDLPPLFIGTYCGNHECKLKTDCSNCTAINNILGSIQCSGDMHYIMAQGMCDELALCNC